LPAGWLLDLTRFVARLGRGPMTGIDRVEAAWLDRLLGDPAPLHALVRTRAGFLLLDRAGAAALRAAAGAALPPADLLGRLCWPRDPRRARAEAAARRLAVARALPAALPRLLRRHLPAGTTALNLGHANLAARVFAALHGVPGARVAVMLHDTIPIDRPELAGPGAPARLAAGLAAVAGAADLVIHTAAATRRQTEAHLARAGRVPPGVTAPLGVALPAADAPLPAGPDPARPWFLALGTIEPRKNHALLLDLWEMLPDAPRPQLVIAGTRGWAERALFARLDAHRGGAGGVWELSGLADGAVGRLLRGARALLFPSLAEGFGLPPVEAATVGTPVVCSDLPVHREILGDYPVYANPADAYAWRDHVLRLARTAERRPPRPAPAWDAHFDTVLGALAGERRTEVPVSPDGG
jgi:glycosyltransferase involved in cell wall biosynthesis